MPGPSTTPKYLLQEPTTGLYIIPRTQRLTQSVRQAGHTTRTAALLAANAYIADQPHELVRVDA